MIRFFKDRLIPPALREGYERRLSNLLQRDLALEHSASPESLAVPDQTGAEEGRQTAIDALREAFRGEDVEPMIVAFSQQALDSSEDLQRLYQLFIEAQNKEGIRPPRVFALPADTEILKAAVEALRPWPEAVVDVTIYAQGGEVNADAVEIRHLTGATVVVINRLAVNFETLLGELGLPPPVVAHLSELVRTAVGLEDISV